MEKLKAAVLQLVILVVELQPDSQFFKELKQVVESMQEEEL